MIYIYLCSQWLSQKNTTTCANGKNPGRGLGQALKRGSVYQFMGCIVCIYLSKDTVLYCMYLLVKGYCVVVYVFTCQRILCCIVCIYLSKGTMLYCMYLLVKGYYVVLYLTIVSYCSRCSPLLYHTAPDVVLLSYHTAPDVALYCIILLPM